MPELIYRSAEETDIPVIFQLCKDLIDAYEDTASIDYDSVMHWVEGKIRSNISSYSCVYLEGEKVGYFCLSAQNDDYELDDFYVFPAFRNKGVGSEILNHCLKTADRPVFLYVFKKNVGAIRLYERFGFSVSQVVGNTRLIMRHDG